MASTSLGVGDTLGEGIRGGAELPSSPSAPPLCETPAAAVSTPRGSGSDDEEGGSSSSSPASGARTCYVSFRSLVGDTSSTSSASPEGGSSFSSSAPGARTCYVSFRSLLGHTSSTSSASRCVKSLPADRARQVLDVGARVNGGCREAGGAARHGSRSVDLHGPSAVTSNTSLVEEPGQQEIGTSTKIVEKHLQSNQTNQEDIRLCVDHLVHLCLEREKRDLEECKRQQVAGQMAIDLRGIFVKSEDIAGYLKHLSSKSEQHVVEEISSDVKDLSTRSRETVDHLRGLSSQADQILEAKIEDRAKRNLEEKKTQQVIEAMAADLCDMSSLSMEMADHWRASQADQDGANLLKSCQTVLGDFVFFMLSLIPWLLHTDEKSPPGKYYNLLFCVTGLAFLGMFGYVLSHIARGTGWVRAVYCISAVAVISTVGLVAYALFSFIPSGYEHYDMAYKIYIGLFSVVGIALLGSWCFNHCQATCKESPPDSPHPLLNSLL